MLSRVIAADRKKTVLASFHLTPLETYILGALLAAATGVLVNIHMATQAHAALLAFIMLLGAVVNPITGAQFVAKLPPGVVVVVQAALGVVVILVQSWSLGSVWLTVVSVVLVIANTLGLGPTEPAPATGGPVGARRI